MTIENTSLLITLTAASDLSAKQWYGVKVDSAGKAAAITATTDICAGVLRNKPETGEAAEICPVGAGGVARMILGATIDEGALVTIDSTGRAAASAAANYTIGLTLKGGAVGEIGSILLTPFTVKA